MKRSAWFPVSLWLMCLGCLVALLFAPVAARADVPLNSTPDPQVWVTNGTVRATAIGPDGTTYIGGDFTYVGPATGSGVALNATSGARDTSFPFVDGRVDAAVPDGAGGFYISGTFTVVGGFARNNIAHILAGGSVDAAFDPSANNSVMALAVSGTTVYAGGGFTVIGGQSRNGIAALDATTGAATAWNPNAGGTSPYVWALAVSGSTVYAGGDFTSIGGQGRNYIAALDASSGLATAWNPNASGGVYSTKVRALAVSGATVYVGGSFFNIGGQHRLNIAALDASSGTATVWDPSAGGGARGETIVYALAVSGATVYAGGNFWSIGGQSRNYIAALDASGGLATAWDPNASSVVYALAVSGSTVYAGGWFTTNIGGQSRRCIAALDASSGLATAWDPSASDWVDALAVSGATVYAGGGFNSVGGRAQRYIAALDASSGTATAWNPNAGGTVRALAVSGTTVYAGGGFTSIGGQSRNGIAALDATTGLATAWDPNAGPSYSSVYALAVLGSAVYAGGDFTSIGGQSRNRIAALDATSGLATAWNPNASSTVRALAVAGATVYAGGDFTLIGGQTRNYIAALDASSAAATAWNPNAGGTVRALGVAGATVYAGGGFTSIGDQTRNNIAALDASSGLATAWDPNASDWVYALAVSGTTVYAGGTFTSIGGQTRNYVAALDASGAAAAWDPNAIYTTYNWVEAGGVYTLAVSGATVYAGGDFTTLGGHYQPHLARFSPPDTTPPHTSNDAPAAWQQGAVTVQLTPIDSGSGMSGGLAKTEYSTDEGATWHRGTVVTYGTWKRGGGSGLHSLLYRSTDAAGNLEEERSCEVKIDARPPRTTDDAPLTPQTHDVTVHLTAADSLTGVTACSDVKETWYSVDGAGWVKGSSATITAASYVGLHWICYYSVDNAGNAEMTRWCSVTISAGALVKRALRGFARR